MIDWCAILIPIYPPHYEYAYKFIEKTSDIFHLYFIFSSEEDYSLFQRKDEIHFFLMPPTSPEGIINKKKLFGLSSLQNSSYTYILVIDAETDFLRSSFSEKNLADKIKTIFQAKQIYGKTIEHFREQKTMSHVIHSCISLFPPEVWTPLLEETESFTIYSWWSDLPVYRREDIEDFLKYIPFEQLQFTHFDHILYSYYLIAYKGFHMCNLSSYIKGNIPLDYFIGTSEEQLISLYEKGLGFSYINYALYKTFPHFFQKIGAIFLYHLDRTYIENLIV